MLVRYKKCSNKEIYRTLDKCSPTCPPDRYIDVDEKKCILNCPPDKFIYGKTCIKKCPNNFYDQNRICGGPSNKRWSHINISNDGKIIYAVTFTNEFYLFYNNIWKKSDYLFNGNIINLKTSGKGNIIIILTQIKNDQNLIENNIYISYNYAYSWEKIDLTSNINLYINQGKIIDFDINEDGIMAFFLCTSQINDIPISDESNSLIIKYNISYKNVLREDYHKGYNFNNISCSKIDDDYAYILSLKSSQNNSIIGFVYDKINNLFLSNVNFIINKIEMSKNLSKLICTTDDKKIIIYNIIITNNNIIYDNFFEKTYQDIVYVSSDNYGKNILGYTFTSGFTGRLIKYTIDQNIKEINVVNPTNKRFTNAYVSKSLDQDLDGKYQIVSEDNGNLYYSTDYGNNWIKI